jgi:hypothetical protein
MIATPSIVSKMERDYLPAPHGKPEAGSQAPLAGDLICPAATTIIMQEIARLSLTPASNQVY